MGAMKKLDLSILTALRGSGGGGSQEPRTPVESPDSLHSIAYARILDLVGEGEIVGFADQANPLSCVYLNETAVANVDGSLNFRNIQIDSRVGTQTQDYIPGFDGVENEISVNVELRDDITWTRSITNLNLNELRVRLSTPALSKADTSNGDIHGYRVGYRIDLRTDDGAFLTVFTGAFAGKTTTKYERSHRIGLPPAATGWTVQVVRTTPNADSSAVQDMMMVDSYTEIINAKLRMPMSAAVSVIVDAEQFNNIPSRAYHLKGRIIRVPSNYDPDTRTYIGVWDGTFQSRYSNNPAWVFYDMALNTRYGLGHLVPNELVDKWTLYRIAQYCDELLDDGFGGQEPRFTCNLFLQSQNDALRVMQDLATVFRGIIYASGGAITAVADMPEDPVYTYTQANVIDGKFAYSGSARKARHTVALVSWNDMTDFGRAKIEYVDDPQGIERYGIQETDVICVGCTSRGQARRFGLYLLTTERYETDTVAFSVGLDGTVAAPGKIIQIADPLRAGQRRGGRVRSATIASITVDLIPTVAVGDDVIVTLPGGTTEKRVIESIVGNTITVTVAFSAVPVEQSVWAVESDDLALQTFRVLSVQEMDNNEQLGYTISALQHVPGKFAFVDTGIMIEEPPIAPVPKSMVPSPTGLVVTPRDVADQNTATKVVNLSWNAVPVAVAYQVQWRQSEGSWIDLGKIGATNVDIAGIRMGGFEVQVVAFDSMGRRSLPTFGGPYNIPAVITPPVAIVDLQTGLETLEQIGLENQQAIADEIVARQQTDAQLAVVRAQVGDILQADEWNSTTAYPVNDLVQSAGKLYRALQDVPAGTPLTDTLYWELLGNYSSLGDAVAAHASQIDVNTSEIGSLASTVTQQGAAIADKADTTALTALESRVTNNEGTLGTHSTQISNLTANLSNKADSTALTALTARVDDVEGDVTTLSSQLTSLSTQVDGKAETSAVSALEARITDVEGVNTTQSSAITSLETSVAGKADVTAMESLTTRVSDVEAAGYGVNLLPNSTLSLGAKLWNYYVTENWNTPSINLAGSNWTPPGMQSWGVVAKQDVVTSSDFVNLTSPKTPVTEGVEYLASLYTNAHRCDVKCFLQWYDENANGLPATEGDSHTGALTGELGGSNLAVWTRLTASAVAPAGARYAAVIMQALGNGTAETNPPYAWVLRPMLEVKRPGQTEPSPWNAGGYEAMAQHALVLDVNGHVVGWKFLNDGSEGIFSIVADKFQIIGSSGGARTEFSSGNWRVYDASGVLRVRMGIW